MYVWCILFIIDSSCMISLVLFSLFVIDSGYLLYVVLLFCACHVCYLCFMVMSTRSTKCTAAFALWHVCFLTIWNSQYTATFILSVLIKRNVESRRVIHPLHILCFLGFVWGTVKRIFWFSIIYPADSIPVENDSTVFIWWQWRILLVWFPFPVCTILWLL